MHSSVSHNLELSVISALCLHAPHPNPPLCLISLSAFNKQPWREIQERWKIFGFVSTPSQNAEYYKFHAQVG